jgi:hypothetical protein
MTRCWDQMWLHCSGIVKRTSRFSIIGTGHAYRLEAAKQRQNHRSKVHRS